VVGDDVQPLCGEWGASRSWTKARSAVTCQRCLEAQVAPGVISRS
jgi:hypothetical protein